MIVLQDVCKSYDGGAQLSVRDVSLRVPAGQLLVLLGGSGCGKTTTLKMINRLIEPTAGRIEVDGRDVRTVDPAQLRRGIGYVFQGIGLFPHMTVAENVAVVPRLLGWAARPDRGPRRRAAGPGPPAARAIPRRGCRGSSPAGSSSASGSPAPWRPARGSCCWTSRSAPSTRSPATSSGASSCRSAGGWG